MILIGFDGSDGGRDALELALVLAGLGDSRLSVVTVLPYAPLPITPAVLADEEETGLPELFEEARSRLAPFEVETRAFGGGSAAAVLGDIAEQESASTIVVGSPHRGAVGRAIAGSVAHGLLHGAPCEVATAPHGYAGERHPGPRAIGVAYDGTPESKAALRRAEELALSANATLEIFTVVAPPIALPGVPGYAPSTAPDPGQVIREAASSVDERLGVTTRLLEGVPGEEIAAACGERIDLLVAGSRGYGPIARVLLGSVSAALVRNAPCPVIVVPRR